MGALKISNMSNSELTGQTDVKVTELGVGKNRGGGLPMFHVKFIKSRCDMSLSLIYLYVPCQFGEVSALHVIIFNLLSCR